MTYVFETDSFRNSKNNATIYVERYTDRLDSPSNWTEPVWKILLHRDGCQYAQVIKDNLKHKPSKRKIQEYITEL